MTPLKGLRQLLQDWIEDESIDDVFQNYLNYAVAECESIVNFSELRKTVDIVVDDTGVFTEPARCRELIDVIPQTDSGYPQFKFIKRDRTFTQVSGSVREHTISPYPGFGDHEASYECSYTQGGTTLTQTGSSYFDADDIGKRVMLSEGSEVYEIIAYTDIGDVDEVEVYPVIAEVTSAAATVLLNPAGTCKYILRDLYNNPYEGTVTVTYQAKHPVLFQDSSLLLIPCPRSVALIALQHALITNKYDVDAERLATAVMMAKNQELDNHTFKTTSSIRTDTLFSVRSLRNSYTPR